MEQVNQVVAKRVDRLGKHPLLHFHDTFTDIDFQQFRMVGWGGDLHQGTCMVIR